MQFLKWIFGIFFLLLVAYISLLFVNEYKQKKEYRRTHFPCTYIKGMCTVKPTWKNCGGGIPLDYCELKLNNRL